ncbi:MAG TPA: Gfo/Idh/MocA family oxidoreductase [Solirubrobacteraceae bacterium]|nr:Gfo/Idh/MocA family oxidoreductase [Solirubrobacteraceae bacterium]
MNGAPVRLGLVGCGRLAELGYAPAARAATGVEIVAVSDPDRDRRGLLADKLQASGHARISELLASAPLDGIVVCTAPEHHEEVAAAVAQAGLVSLVEKPPAPDAAGALRLAALAPAPWIGFNRRFDQGLELARRVPPAGDLELRMVLHYRRRSWRPVSGGDDALLDLAPHFIDLALYLTAGLPSAVRAHAARERAGIELATSRARVSIECATDRPYHEVVELLDTSGRRIARAERGGRARGVAARVWPGAHPLVRSLTAQLEAFARALRGGDPGPLATAGEGAAVMCVLDAAARSDAIGGETVAVEGVTLADAEVS